MEDCTVSEENSATPVETKMCKFRTASEQRLYLAYKTLKFMVQSHGSDIRKGIHLGLPVWTLIGKELNALSGVEKTPDMWRKTYTSAKYFVHLKFFRYLKSKKIDKNCIDWKLFSIKDLLYLQDLRSEGYPDMPDVHLLLKACEEKKNFLSEPTQDNTASNESLQFANTDDRSRDRNSETGIEPWSAAHFADPLRLYDQNASTESGPPLQSDIKIETPRMQCHTKDMYNFPRNDQAVIISSMPDFPMQPEATACPDFAHFGSSPQIHQAKSIPAETSDTPAYQYFQNQPSAVDQKDQPQPSAGFRSPRPQELMGPDWDFEQTLLQINEKMLREKTKHNKLLKKQNRLLKRAHREQRKQTETLTKLLEQLIQRGT